MDLGQRVIEKAILFVEANGAYMQARGDFSHIQRAALNDVFFAQDELEAAVKAYKVKLADVGDLVPGDEVIVPIREHWKVTWLGVASDSETLAQAMAKMREMEKGS